MDNKKISYRFNPYTFARISAMKSLLLQKGDYDKLMKMDLSEIIKFLQSGVYKDEINTLAIKYSGLKLMEKALNMHLIKIFSKLLVISDPATQYLMDQYLKRYDFWNIKTIMRATTSNISSEEIADLLLPVGSINKERLKRIISKKELREILNESGLVNMEHFKAALDAYESSKNLAEIENLLDYHYYLDTNSFAMNIPVQGKLFKEFFQYEIDVYNLKLLMKKLFFKLDKDTLSKYIIYGGKEISSNMMKHLMEKDSLTSFMKELSKTVFGKEIKESGEDMLKYEMQFEKFLLEKSSLLFHQHPLTVDVVLGFMFEKEIEIKNLRIIIKSKALEFTEDYVKDMIVIG